MIRSRQGVNLPGVRLGVSALLPEDIDHAMWAVTIDAEFVSRYLPHVPDGTSVRILARERLTALKPAVAAFVSQSGHTVEVRSAPGFHDRYLFVDGQACYQSGASFKDGAKKAPTVLTQITDAFSAVLNTYEELWAQATLL